MSEAEQRIEERDVGDGRKDVLVAAPVSPVAKEKAAREKRWAREEVREAREEELRRHWSDAYATDVEKRGGLAALVKELPRNREWELPRAPESVGAAPYGKPSPGDVETELAAMIAECRHFMRGVAFESARMTPSASERIIFIDSACRLAEAGAKVGQSVAGLRGRETNVREVVQRIRVEDSRRVEGRGEGRGEGEGA